jgi:membrane protease YdiL (CAAX protease family)
MASAPEVPGGLVQIGTCPYCGHALVEGYYFCLSCATPFRRAEDVLPAVPPRQLTDGELVDRKVPQVKTIFWTYFSVLIGCAILGLLLSYGVAGEASEPNVLAMVLVQEVGLIVTTVVFTALYWPSLAVQFKRLGLLQPWFWLSLAALAVLLAINYGYHSWLRSLAPDDVGGGLIQELRDAGLTMPMMVVIICIFPAVVEEIAFRGLIQHWLKTAIQPWKAMVLASFLFTIMHFSILSFFYLFGVGMLLGLAKYKTRSLWPPMVLHFLHNFVVLAYFN